MEYEVVVGGGGVRKTTTRAQCNIAPTADFGRDTQKMSSSVSVINNFSLNERGVRRAMTKLLKKSEPTGARIERRKVPNDLHVAYNNLSYHLSPSLTWPPTSHSSATHSSPIRWRKNPSLKRDEERTPSMASASGTGCLRKWTRHHSFGNEFDYVFVADSALYTRSVAVCLPCKSSISFINHAALQYF